MKLAIILLAVLRCSQSLALPSPPLAWEDIKGENVYIQPISNYTVDLPVHGRIIGGSEVAPHSIPYQVALIIDGSGFCGASLISRQVVLSAAHCTIRASSVQVILGAHNVQNTEATQVTMTVTSSNINNHPLYIPLTLANDVSLIGLPSVVTLNSNIQTIPLAPSNAGTYAGSSGFITGWGTTSDSSSAMSPVLQGVIAPIITNADCLSSFGMLYVRSSTICTSGAGIVGACSGDSGGPLVVNGVQVGVISFNSATGCESGNPTAYARVSSFIDWIEENSDLPA